MADTELTMTIDAKGLDITDESAVSEALVTMLQEFKSREAGESFKIDMDTVELKSFEVLSTNAAPATPTPPRIPEKLAPGAVVRIDYSHFDIHEAEFPVLGKIVSDPYCTGDQFYVQTTSGNRWYLQAHDEGTGWTFVATAREAAALAAS